MHSPYSFSGQDFLGFALDRAEWGIWKLDYARNEYRTGGGDSYHARAGHDF